MFAPRNSSPIQLCEGIASYQVIKKKIKINKTQYDLFTFVEYRILTYLSIHYTFLF